MLDTSSDPAFDPAFDPALDPDPDDPVLVDYIRRLSRWGLWGDDDELGALNLVGPEQVRAAAALVTAGRVISMSLPYDQAGPQPGGLRNNPMLVTTATGTDHLANRQASSRASFHARPGFGFSDDMVIMPTQSGTQWDSLAHIFHRGQMWNGYSAADHSAAGAARNGIQQWADRLVLRGVLVDVARLHGVDALEPGYAIGVDDVERCLQSQGVSVERGDALVVRTGHLGARRTAWGDYAGGPAPGLSLHIAPWLHEHEVAAIVSDTWGIEVRPNEIDHFQPLHTVALVHMGLAFGEIFDLEPLAEDCAADGRYAFMLAASPLPITGAVGSPVGAVAIK